jgi:tetratricopeptide (TPR) repeat protein
MIIYGSRMYFRQRRIKTWGVCDQCGHYGAQANYSARRWWHIYFIPLIPSGPVVRVLHECRKCHQCLIVPQDRLPALTGEIGQQVARAVAALVQGQTAFPTGDERGMVDALLYLADAAGELVALDEVAEVEQLINLLDGQRMPLATAVARATVAALRGRIDEAVEAYRQALAQAPDHGILHARLGELLRRHRRIDEARASFRAARRVLPDDLNLLQVLLDLAADRRDDAEFVALHAELAARNAARAAEPRLRKQLARARRRLPAT